MKCSGMRRQLPENWQPSTDGKFASVSTALVKSKVITLHPFTPPPSLVRTSAPKQCCMHEFMTCEFLGPGVSVRGNLTPWEL